MRPNVRVVFALVMTCFFVSGVAGLIYQVAWARYLALFLGHTSYAVVAVLVAFMGGLAIGNAALGAVADRSEKPLAFYGWLEIGIAIYGLLFPYYFQFCHDLYISAARSIGGAGTPLLLLKFVFSFLTIVLPTTLMGATFPVLAKFVTRSLAELRERVASLYFINSLGAVFGCFVADFWWLPKLGLEMTVLGSAALNLFVGLIALGMSRAILEGSPTEATRAPAAHPASDEYFSALDLKVATIAIGASGFVAMLYEVAWTRLLALALGSSTHAFSIMLITFIAGIAVGAAVIARWKSLARTLDAFGWAELALAGAVLVSMFAYELLPYWFTRAAQLLARRPEAYPLYELAQGLTCFAVMFMPAVCLGTTLPLASRIATAELARTGRSVGKIFAVNTVGTVLGAAVTGLVLMPMFGLSSTFAIGIVLNAAIGLIILYRSHLVRVQGAMIATAVVAGVCVVWAAHSFFEPLWRASFTQGVWRKRANVESVKAFRDAGKMFRFKYYKDGAGSTVMLHYYEANPNYLSLRVNGKTDASSGDVGTQLILGHLPSLMHTSATNALVIGLGSGMTSGAILRHTNIQSATAVEISPEMAEAAQYFERFNDNVLKNPRFHLAVEDAKSFLKTSDQKFDIIVSEPSNPWMAGVASVFSVEFYQTCAERLAKGGVMVQWVQIYETSDETLQTVVKTFGTVFPFISLWRSQDGDLILVGTPEPRVVDVDAFVARMGDPRIHQDLLRGGFSEPLALLSREVMSSQNGAFLAKAENVVHSDFFPVLEYMSQLGFFVGSSTTLFDNYDETRSPRALTLLGEYLRKHPLTNDDLHRAAKAVLDNQIPEQRLALSLMQRWVQVETNSTLPLEMIERLTAPRPAAVTEELRMAEKHEWILEQAKTDITALHFYERVLMRAYRAKRTVFYIPDTSRLEQVLAILLERDPKNQRVYNLHLAELAWDRGDDQMCLRLGAPALNPDRRFGPLVFTLDEFAPRQILYNMIESSLRTGDYAQAKVIADQARVGGYLKPGELFFPPLDFVCRKVAAITDAAPAGARK